MSNQTDTDWTATQLLQGSGLPVVRVKGTGSGDAVVIWRNPPSGGDVTAAETALSGYTTHQHAV